MKKIKTLTMLTLIAGISITTNAQLKVGKSPTSLAAGANLDVHADDDNRFYIKKSNGFVGIGTIDPTVNLLVDGGFFEVSPAGSRTGDLHFGTSSQSGVRIAESGSIASQRFNDGNPNLYLAKSGTIGNGNFLRLMHDNNIIGGINTNTDAIDRMHIWSRNGLSFNGANSLNVVQLFLSANGNLGIGSSTTPTSKLQVTGLAGYATDAAAGAAGLTAGAFYQTQGHATLPNGVLMIKQ